MGRIEELEARIAALEQGISANSEALSPNYITVDPATGLTGATFSGLIKAQGVQLKEAIGSGAPTLTNSVQWVDPANVVKGYVFERNKPPHQIQIAATDGAVSCGLEADAASSTGVGQAIGFANGTGGAYSTKVIDSNGAAGCILAPDPVQNTRQIMGDAAMCATATDNVSYGAGKGDPIAAMGAVPIFDTYGRFSGSTYICRQAGTFLCGLQVSCTLANATSCSLSVRNTSTGAETGIQNSSPASLIWSTSCCLLINTTAAGQALEMLFGVSQNVSLRRIDTVYGTYTTAFTVVQVG